MMGSALRVWLLCLSALVGVYLCSSGLLRLNEVFAQPPAPSPSTARSRSREHATTSADVRHSEKLYDRLVVVLIDALRADMVLGSDVMYGKAAAAGGDELSANMAYTRDLVASGQALGYIGHASVPTGESHNTMD